MANSPDSVDSWPGFLAQLNKTFLLIRDIFGYALPGGVFLAIGLISKRFSLGDIQNLLHPYQPPAWAVFALLVATCYVAGDVMASIAYFPIAIWKWLQSEILWIAKSLAAKPKGLRSKMLWIAKSLADNPTEVTGDLLEIRERHTGFFVESDRRETLLLLSGSTAVALLGGYAVFYAYKPQPSTLFLIAGLVLILEFPTGISHLRRVRAAIRWANEIADPPMIESVDPQNSRASSLATLVIVGTNLKSVRAVRLVRGADELPGTDVTTSATMVRCKIQIGAAGGGANWDLVVETEGGVQGKKEGAFTITT